ncbi:MAG: hypothetical protein MJ219_01875 [Mycoplasmoidaceae bacterium]|nr:hypothetical protein [Mycoplasmoidaceae bacterium]
MKLNSKMAYALAYVLYKKHRAKIADVGELENVFYVDFESPEIISIDHFKQLQNEVCEFIYNRATKAESKQKPIANVLACQCLKKNKYLSY